ncbi:leucyl/phenylalanyl-tRNA--protein transferase [Arcobacter sp. LA11]|uniref:leucyl/phenylalanyl-tRNA--protein transferase n=1 Tax=Arcobacter sp. LA11 TaxID=1898176 RepID=UPI000ADF289D|nr:leucyl/phenylalanyl-tRNA--protein transferase [Arcobacter sp. LA11]
MNILPLDKYSYSFPNPLYACDEGILAYGGDLSTTRLLKAYLNGIFPWYNKTDPILWWSPNPRMILNLNEFKVSKSLKKTIDKNIFEIKFDSNFKQVMIECSKINREGQNGTWILPEIIEAYTKLYEMKFAHSFEAYFNGELVGGGYGINIGNIFCGESMFSKKNDASKVALYYLVQRLKSNGFKMIDCQIPTPHLESLGAKKIPREEFLNLVCESKENPKNF